MAIIPLDFLETLAAERGVSQGELEVLSLALLEGQSIAAIAAKLQLKPEAVRKRLGEVYKKFEIAGKGPGKMAKLQQLLISQYQQRQGQRTGQSFPTQTSAPEAAIASSGQHWDGAPALEAFYGRSQELTQLQKWIAEEGSKLIAILGFGGIGKTTLAVKLGREIQSEFEVLIWRSLRHAPPLTNYLADLINCLHPQTAITANIDGQIAELMSILRQRRCLLILDDVETILSKEDLAGNYAEGFEEYGEFFRRIATESHQSCLVFSSAEKLTDLASLEGAKVRSLQLAGSPEICEKILEERGLSGSRDWQDLILRYGGNPLAVKVISSTVKDLYNGQVTDFVKNTLFIGDIRYLLDQPFERLSQEEKDLMYWLAVERKPVSLGELPQKFLWAVSSSELLATMGSLGRRSLVEKIIEKGQSLFTLQPVVMKYVTTQLVEEVGGEIMEVIKTQDLEAIAILKNYTLTQKDPGGRSLIAQVKNSLQSRFIRNPKSFQNQIAKLETFLAKMPESSLEVGYAKDNIQEFINLVMSDFQKATNKDRS
ncbi:MAG: NB-ARC domain-containing protein [Cyanobacteriota bacterium]|nr:NB-ARC domain-containing protein [Cyanobacteriota bacterium]